jgi:thiol:disulfide interchange protein
VNIRTTLGFVLICIVAAACQKSSAIDAAVNSARASHKSLMVEFGADWCSDCQELSHELQREPLQSCLDENVDRLKIDVGEFNRNLDTARSLGIDIKNGVIPTAVFFPATSGFPTTRTGTPNILSFLKQSCANTDN